MAATGGFFFFTRILFPALPKLWDIQEGLSFPPKFCSRSYQNYGTYRRVFLFQKNFVSNVTKIMGHTGGSFFFTRILFPMLPKLWDIQEGLSVSPEFCSWRYQNYGTYRRVFFTRICSRPYQNYGTYRRVFLFHQNFVPDVTKIIGHTGGSFFFTRILSPTILKFRDILMKKKHLLKIYKQSSYVLTIRPRLAFCHRQPRG